MSIDFFGFPVSVIDRIAGELHLADLLNLGILSKRSRQVSRLALRPYACEMKIKFERGSIPTLEFTNGTYFCYQPLAPEFEESQLEKFKDYIKQYFPLFTGNLKIAISFKHLGSSNFVAAILDIVHLSKVPVTNLILEEYTGNQLIMKSISLCSETTSLSLMCRPTIYGFRDEIGRSLANKVLGSQKLEIFWSKWVTPEIIMKNFKKCKELLLHNSSFDQLDVIRILKHWKTGSSIRKLRLNVGQRWYGAQIFRELEGDYFFDGFRPFPYQFMVPAMLPNCFVIAQDNTGVRAVIAYQDNEAHGTLVLDCDSPLLQY
ncbi:hypothetical protein L5515_016680 [Caenorhabditis briggsae]|uniref:F-box domain-containing protein n=1 Tax=Caenorhabditis briggsae TaxID=6238 RepID=A0AAE9FHM7_CAEBR|nr:hypothetical protein L5515_016680 [Caenorhabditis briggsae]